MPLSKEAIGWCSLISTCNSSSNVLVAFITEIQELEKLQTKATIKIQSTIRKHLAIKERNRRLHKRIEKLHKFAIKIQCFQRKHTAMRRVKEMFMIRHKYLINIVIMKYDRNIKF